MPTHRKIIRIDALKRAILTHLRLGASGLVEARVSLD
jgi:hypothetical protein